MFSIVFFLVSLPVLLPVLSLEFQLPLLLRSALRWQPQVICTVVVYIHPADVGLVVADFSKRIPHQCMKRGTQTLRGSGPF